MTRPPPKLVERTSTPNIVPVTVESSALISNCRPLPDDIATLNDADTGCQYCGVSYLLLSKYDRIVAHVSRLERELETLKTYAVDYPVLVANHATLETAYKETMACLREVEEELARSKEEAGKAIRATHELQLRYTRLTYDYETMTTRHNWMDDGLKAQIRALVGGFDYWRDQVAFLKSQLGSLRAEYVSENKAMVESSLADISSQLYAFIPSMIENQVTTKVSKIATLTKDKMLAMEEEMVDLNAELEAGFEKLLDALRLLDQMHEAAQHFDERVQAVKDESRGQTTSLEQEIMSLKPQIEDYEQRIQLVIFERDDVLRTLHAERDSTTQQIASLTGTLNQRDAELRNLQKSFEDERRALEHGGSSAVSKMNRALAQKDLEMQKLNTAIADLKSKIDTMAQERTLTIEAHQSRVKQLQDKYQDIRKAEKDRDRSTEESAEKTEARLKAKFEVEKIELLTLQKQNFQKQLTDLQSKLQSQIDAARVSRDHAVSDAKRKLAAMDEETRVILEKTKSENDQLKTRLVALELKLMQPTSLPTSTPQKNESLEVELARKDAEIAFLKETVKMECEERMELLTTLDTLQRGVPEKSTAIDTGTEVARMSESDQELANALPPVLGAMQPIAHVDATTRSYQKLMSMAAVKKGQKLKQAAKACIFTLMGE
ncbi:hypothetical protein BC830DRAFT_1171694 [Chytriomyces sp. MP71]|nr:hypothetical protein BC830DRAFT_1171694 [Chytriomyces sp. MP71]